MNIQAFVEGWLCSAIFIWLFVFTLSRWLRRKKETRLDRMMRRQASDAHRAYWRPITTRWWTWLGASWAVGSVLIFAPLIAKLIKEVLK